MGVLWEMTRHLYCISGPGYQDDKFWEALVASRSDRLETCPKCGRQFDPLTPPFAIEWTRDRWVGKSQRVGDFTWVYKGCIVVTERVKDACLAADITGLKFDPVETRAFMPRKNSKPVIVDAPPIWLGRPVVTIHLDLAQSQRTLISQCEVCAYSRSEVAPNAHIVICPPIENSIPDVFLVAELPSYPFCSDRFHDLVVENQFTNVVVKKRGVLRCMEG